MSLAQLFKGVDTVLLRHHDVEQKQVDAIVELTQRLLPVMGHQHVKAFHVEQLL